MAPQPTDRTQQSTLVSMKHYLCMLIGLGNTTNFTLCSSNAPVSGIYAPLPLHGADVGQLQGGDLHPQFH